MMHISPRLTRLLASVALGVMLGHTGAATAASDARVFPLRAFFHDDKVGSTLDARFRAEVAAQTPARLAAELHQQMTAAFGARIGPLDRSTIGRTFVASFQATRAIAYKVPKGNGNVDLVASVSASLYFTNVQTGEILKTLSDSVVSQATVPGSQPIDGAVRQQFARALQAVMKELVDKAAVEFTPTNIDVKVTDLSGNLLVLDTGHRKGVQLGDSLSDASGQLIEVVYAAADYAVAQRVLADQAGPGSVFQKYLSHASDGKVRPRTVVFVESVPNGYSKEYVAQMFSELVGTKAPLSMVLVSPGFVEVLSTVTQQASLTRSDTATRRTPEQVIRLRVEEPIIYEARTNLDFKKLRHYETLAFADVIDTEGRINFSAVGKDTIDDTISNEIGPGMEERREVTVKNALLNLAERFATLSEQRQERIEIVAGAAGAAAVVGTGRVFAPQQRGMVLRQVTARVGKDSQKVWLPTTEAYVEPGADPARLPLSPGLTLQSPEQPILPGQLFEVRRFGTTPRSAQRFRLCEEAPESLGNTRTPSLIALATQALSQQMPGMFYAPDMPASIDRLIKPASNFSSTIAWKLPTTIPTCVQPVERVNVGEAQCAATCERPLSARYTLRVRSGADILARPMAEAQFRSGGYYVQTEAAQLVRLIDADLIDEAAPLLDKVAAQIRLPAP